MHVFRLDETILCLYQAHYSLLGGGNRGRLETDYIYRLQGPWFLAGNFLPFRYPLLSHHLQAHVFDQRPGSAATMTLNAAQKTNLSVTWILGGIATVTVFTRMYVRFFQQRTPGCDDYVMILCWVCGPGGRTNELQ